MHGTCRDRQADCARVHITPGGDYGPVELRLAMDHLPQLAVFSGADHDKQRGPARQLPTAPQQHCCQVYQSVTYNQQQHSSGQQQCAMDGQKTSPAAFTLAMRASRRDSRSPNVEGVIPTGLSTTAYSSARHSSQRSCSQVATAGRGNECSIQHTYWANQQQMLRVWEHWAASTWFVVE
jgi:hypothetical protein